jgi:hypothetical protein
MKKVTTLLRTEKTREPRDDQCGDDRGSKNNGSTTTIFHEA